MAVSENSQIQHHNADHGQDNGPGNGLPGLGNFLAEGCDATIAGVGYKHERRAVQNPPPVGIIEGGLKRVEPAARSTTARRQPGPPDPAG